MCGIEMAHPHYKSLHNYEKVRTDTTVQNVTLDLSKK